MKEKVQRLAGKISTQRHLAAIRDAMSTALPLIIIGSVFMIISSFPIKAVTDFLGNVGLNEFLYKATDATFGFAGFAVIFSLSYNLGRTYKIDQVAVGLISLTSFILLTPIISSDSGNAFLFKYFGMSGLFVGLIVAIISTEIYNFLVKKNVKIKMPDTVPPNVEKSFSALLPGLIITTFWLVVLFALNSVGVENVHDLIASLISKPLSYLTATLPGVIGIILLQCFFWFFGIHGAQVTGSVIEPLLFAQTEQNKIAFMAGQEVPNIVTYEFLYNFVFPGGAGALIALAILLYFFSKSEQNKALGKLSLVPVSFQIAEPVIYGFPTVLNPKIVIPVVLAPVVNAIICYSSMAIGLVPKPVGVAVPWTTPPVIAGYLASGNDIRGALLNIVCIFVSILIYYPFFKFDDNEKLRREKEKKINN